MEEKDALRTLQEITTLMTDQSFGGWQYWTLWGVGLALVLIFGKIFARGIGKSERTFILVFIGNLIVIGAALAAAWATLTFGGSLFTDSFVLKLLACVAAGLAVLLLTLLLGPVFWADSRMAALLACLFALAISYGGMFATDKILEVLARGQGTVEVQRSPLEENQEP